MQPICAMPQDIISRARAYLSKMPVSVALQGGHDSAFNAALALVKGFGLSEEEAMPLFKEWNLGCLPPWSASDLRHKLRDAARSPKADGFLLEERGRSTRARERRAPDFESEHERQARKRNDWPEFRSLSTSEIHAVANLRGVLPDAVDLLHRAGILRGATVDGHQCFIMRGEHFAQARRIGGELFMLNNGETLKAKNIPGSVGAFVGHPLLFPSVKNVLLVEGCIGLLEGVAALLSVNVREAWSVIAATSASSRFARDPDLLKSLAGRRVVVAPDADDVGLNAAASWLADLEGAGASVEAFELPSGAKDLGDLISNPAKNQKTIDRIFL